MHTILSVRKLADNVKEFIIDAPEVVRHALPGQFVILRVTADGERVPFTICDTDKAKGTLTLLIQVVGATTMRMDALKAGDALADLVGPLGHPTDLGDPKSVLLVGGGIGTAVIYPQAKALFAAGVKTHVIVGARSKHLIMYEEEFRRHSDTLLIATDDGSAGHKGFVTDVVLSLLQKDKAAYDAVFAVGPLPMMKAVANVTRPFNVKTVVSMNPIMIDGTGMCGGCRLTVGGEVKYACVDGPEFDGHAVDFDEALLRLRFYKEQEDRLKCRLLSGTTPSVG